MVRAPAPRTLCRSHTRSSLEFDARVEVALVAEVVVVVEVEARVERRTSKSCVAVATRSDKYTGNQDSPHNVK